MADVVFVINKRSSQVVATGSRTITTVAVNSVNGQTGTVVLDTDDIGEGVSNLYFTNARAASAAPVQSVDGQTSAVNLSGVYAPLAHVGSGGTAHSAATTGAAGFMSAADKTKLDGIAAGAQVNVPTDLSLGTITATSIPLNSSTGADVTLPSATTSLAGLQSAADKTKLDGVAAGATANANTDTMAEGSTNKYFTELRVLATLMAGFTLVAGGTVLAADSLLVAVGKLQKQINDLFSGKQDTLVSGTTLKTVNGSSLLGSGNIAVAAAPAPVITDNTTARTAGLAEAGGYIRWTNTAAKAYTVPPQATVAWAVDTELHGRNCAAGNLTLAPGAGVTLNAPYLGTLVVPPGGAYTLKRGDADVWDVIGQTVAA